MYKHLPLKNTCDKTMQIPKKVVVFSSSKIMLVARPITEIMIVDIM
jgi:hypothetical protein